MPLPFLQIEKGKDYYVLSTIRILGYLQSLGAQSFSQIIKKQVPAHPGALHPNKTIVLSNTVHMHYAMQAEQYFMQLGSGHKMASE